jgi:hypothetical protein
MDGVTPNPLLGQDSSLAALQGAPGGTAPLLPGNANPQAQQPDAVHKLIQQILEASKQKQGLPQPVPAPIPEGKSGEIPGYMQGPGWGFQRFSKQLGSTISNAVSQHKQNELAKAESFWNQLNAAVQSGDQTKIQALMSDPKATKRAAKALNQDWLNPEKTDVWRTALNNVMAQQKQKDQAHQGLMGIFKKLIGERQQPQLSEQQRAQMAQEMMRKMPTMQAQDPKVLAESAKAISELENARANLTRAQAEAKDKYDIRPDANGNIVAIDKSDPTKVIRVTDQSGNAVTGAPKVGQQPKVASIGGVPYGIARNGKILSPGDPEWTAQDAKIFEAAKGATAASDAAKDRRVRLAAETRAQSFAKTREYGVIDSETGGLVMLSPETINQSPGRYAPASQGVQAMNRQAIFGEIDYTAGQVNQAITELPEDGFDAKARAQVSAVLRDTDPRSAWSSFLNSSVAETLSDPQIKYVTGLVSLAESSMSLRSLAGMGQGSDQLRSAIVRMLPGPTTPSRKYAQRQMELFTGEVNALRKSIPKLGKGQTQETPETKAGPKVGTVEGGYRFKGGDPAKQENWVKVGG